LGLPPVAATFFGFSSSSSSPSLAVISFENKSIKEETLIQHLILHQ